jgi:hypothetical protein
MASIHDLILANAKEGRVENRSNLCVLSWRERLSFRNMLLGYFK